MKKLAAFSILLLPLGATGALALPAGQAPTTASPAADVHQIASWRYHANCGWQGGRWVFDQGGGKLVVCRPNRPGRDYVWRDEGPRHGWYHRRDHTWHFNNW